MLPLLFSLSLPPPQQVLARYGSRAQQRAWLLPLLRGTVRSCFCMTEPAVASSDATNITSSIRADPSSGTLVLDGRKWWASGASDPRCRSVEAESAGPVSQRWQQDSPS